MLFYLIGIKGSALSALAKVLIDQGHIVKGVDSDKHFYTEASLKDVQIESFNHMNLKPYYFYIIGNAYINHSVARYIKMKGYYYKEYPVFINEHFKIFKFISVCGSHGKTTTTKMLSHILNDASYIIGDGTGSGRGKNIFVLESCEYKNTFLNYHPDIALILNVDYDHPDFFKSKDDYLKSFEEFSRQSKIVIANGDDNSIRRIMNNSFISYGLNDWNDVIFKYQITSDNTIISILGSSFVIPFVGLHYAYDFVGAYLVSKLLGLTDDEISLRLKGITLPRRRMEKRIINDCIIYHDYAHHPTEIASVYNSLKQMYSDKKIVCVFQPHTISRSVGLKNEFKKSLDMFDFVYLISTFTSVRERLDIELEMEIFKFWDKILIDKKDVKSINKCSDNIIVFLGAGDIDLIFEDFTSIKKMS